MITDVILSWVHALVDAALGLVPAWSPNIPSSQPVVQYLDDLNYFLPIVEVVTAMFTILLIGVPMFVTTCAMWIVGLVRGGGARQ